MLKRISYYGLLGIIAFTLVVSVGLQAAAEEDPMFKEDEKVVTDWEKSVVRAKGYGIAPDNASSAAQKKIMAREAAITMAQRRLLETIKGVKIDSTQTVENAQVKSDVIKKQVSGVIKGAQIIEEKRPADDVYHVVMEVKFYGKDGVMKAILPKLQKESGQAAVSQMQEGTDNRDEQFSNEPSDQREEDRTEIKEKYTGIIINTVDLEVEPALAPKIYGPHNNLVYGMDKINSNGVVTDGIVGYSRSLAGAKSKLRAGDNPLVINAQQVKGEYTTDLVLAAEDAQQMRRLGQQTDIFSKCRIIIVLN